MTDNEKEALRLLKAYTAGSFSIWVLSGQPKATCRAHIMSALLGRKATQKESGVTALRESFYRIASPSGMCRAAEEDNFIGWAKSQF